MGPGRVMLALAFVALGAIVPRGAADALQKASSLPTLEIRSSSVRMVKDFRIALRVRCDGPREGAVCKGDAMLTPGRAALHTTEGLPLTRPHRFKVGANKERRIWLRLTGYARPDAASLRRPQMRKVHALVVGNPGATVSSSKWITLRWGPRRK